MKKILKKFSKLPEIWKILIILSAVLCVLFVLLIIFYIPESQSNNSENQKTTSEKELKIKQEEYDVLKTEYDAYKNRVQQEIGELPSEFVKNTQTCTDEYFSKAITKYNNNGISFSLYKVDQLTDQVSYKYYLNVDDVNNPDCIKEVTSFLTSTIKSKIGKSEDINTYKVELVGMSPKVGFSDIRYYYLLYKDGIYMFDITNGKDFIEVEKPIKDAYVYNLSYNLYENKLIYTIELLPTGCVQDEPCTEIKKMVENFNKSGKGGIWMYDMRTKKHTKLF